MNYRELGRTGEQISEVGFGCWAMGGVWWGGGFTDDDTLAAARRALELGINLFDTADIYGFGHSEEVMANLLRERRKDIFLATKCGVRWENDNVTGVSLKPDYILQACDDSLQRLEIDVIDLYQMHWPDP